VVTATAFQNYSVFLNKTHSHNARAMDDVGYSPPRRRNQKTAPMYNKLAVKDRQAKKGTKVVKKLSKNSLVKERQTKARNDTQLDEYFTSPGKFDILHMSDIYLAWQGWVPPDLQAKAVRQVGDKQRIHLVISHCGHSVAWIFEDYLKT
jgi:hypothetical protein